MNRSGAAVWFHNGRRYYATVVRVAAVAEGEDRTTLVLCFAGLPSTPSKTEKVKCIENMLIHYKFISIQETFQRWFSTLPSSFLLLLGKHSDKVKRLKG